MFHFFFSNNLNLKNQNQNQNKNKKIESYKNDTNKIKLFSNNISANNNTIVVRFYFQSKNNEDLLYKEKNSIQLYLFIQNKLEQSFVLDSNNVNTYYSTEDNQVRVYINYTDDNIKRIFINTCNNLFSNLKYFLEKEQGFYEIFETYYLQKITITNDNENDILSILENDVFFERKEDDTKIDDDTSDDIIYDYIIIGGGPGSILTAYKLAKNNLNKKILLLEANNKTLPDYNKKKYNDTSYWTDAQSDPDFKILLTDTDNKTISLGSGLGGGSLHFGLQYIDHYDLVNLNYSDWYNEFIELSNILSPQTYKYNSNNNNKLPTKAHFDLLSELSSNKNIITYNNKIYSNDLENKTRISYGLLLRDLNNITIRYNSKINKLNFENSKVKSCITFDNKKYFANTFILGAGAINTPAILLRSDINCGNQIYDHGAISLVYKKNDIVNKEEVYKNVKGYYKDEIDDISLPILSLEELIEMNKINKSKQLFIIKHSKLNSNEINRACSSVLPSFSVTLDKMDGIQYIYETNSNNIMIINSLYNNELTSELYDTYVNSYHTLFNQNNIKLVGLCGIKEIEKITIQNKIQDLGFDNNNIIPHLQTHDINHKWQTYYSYLPYLYDTLIVTHAQCKNLPKTGSINISTDNPEELIVNLNHLGSDKQKELTINYIYDAYTKNNESLEKLGYYYQGPKITNKYIEKNLNSIYHYHGTCAVGDVIDNNHKVLEKDNLYICDSSVLSDPWPGSTSVPSAVAGIITAKNIINTEQNNNNIFEWMNKSDNSQITIDTVTKAMNKWNSIINYNSDMFKIKINFVIKELEDNNVLGYAQIKKYYKIKSKEIKDFNNYNYYYDLQNYNLGEILPYEGEIVFNKNIWENMLSTKREDGMSHAYYIALHELGHVIGIGPLWVLNGAMLYDARSETFFYGGINGNREYKKCFPSLKLTYMPIENNGGPGTAEVHPEEGEEGDISVNDRFYNGVLHPGLDHELMTGFAETTNVPLPLSKVTVGLVEDLGYSVNYINADKFTINFNKSLTKTFNSKSNIKCTINYNNINNNKNNQIQNDNNNSFTFNKIEKFKK